MRKDETQLLREVWGKVHRAWQHRKRNPRAFTLIVELVDSVTKALDEAPPKAPRRRRASGGS